MSQRIAVIHDGCGKEPGGAARVSAELATILEADMYVGRTSCYDWYEKEAPNEVILYAKHANRLPNTLRDTYVAYRTGKLHLPEYDVVVSSGAPAKFYQPESFQRHIQYIHHPPLRYAQWLGRSSLTGIRGNIRYLVRKLGMYADWLEMQRVETIIANSRTTEERVKRHYRRDAQIVNPPVTYSDLPILDSEERERYFVYVGRLGPRKRLDTLVRAVSRTNDRLIIAGDGPLRQDLEELAVELSADVEFRGWVSEAERERLMQESRAGVFIPEEEDFGMAIAELLCWGTPLIVADEPNPRYMISDLNGITVDPTVDAVAAAIRSFDPTEYDPESIAESARQRYGKKRFENEIRDIV